MALVKPIGQSVPSFDAKNANIFKFNVRGGDQVVANRLIIRNNESNNIVYNKKINSYKFEHEVPSDTLINGIYYNFYFQTYNIQDNESINSDPIIFICYDTPIIEITNIPEDGVLDSSNFNLNIKYDQAQEELMDIAKVILMDDLENQIFESENIYNKEKPPLEFNYTLLGLSDDTTFKVKATAITINKTIIESPIYTFTTKYLTPALSTLIELENNCEGGFVQIKNNFYVVDSESNPSDIGNNPNYLHDGKLDLTEKGTYLKYIDGFNIARDFTLKLFIENPNEETIATLTSGKKKIQLNFIKDYPYMEDIQKYCVELQAYDNLSEPYTIYSNYVANKNKVIVWVRKINNIFEIRLEELS